MAIAFARLTIYSRSKGQNIVACAAYRAGIKLFNERTGETFDYRNKRDVAYTEILLPENASDKFLDREYLWNQVEKAEKRKDAQTGKDLILALPKELSLSQHIELVQRFAREQFVKQGLIVDFAIHDKGDGNPHAHLLITLRKLEGNSFSAKKPRELNPVFYGSVKKKTFDPWNEHWREFQNAFFVEKKIDLQVDANYLIATRHEGRFSAPKYSVLPSRSKRKTPAPAHATVHYLKEENVFLKQEFLERAQVLPEAILEHLSTKKAVFTDRDLAALVLKNTNTPERYEKLLKQIQSHPEFLFLGNGADEKPRYTTRSTYEREAQMLRFASALARRTSKAVSNRIITKTASTFNLTTEQTETLSYLAKSGDIACLVGRAGTGKTYTMKAVHALYASPSTKVYGAAISGIAAKTLEKETSITSDTIYSLTKRMEQGRWLPEKNSVLVIDEAGMVPLYDMAKIIEFVKQNQMKVILLGDPDQLQPILAGAPFRALTEELGFFEMKDIRRQLDIGDRTASQHLAEGKIGLALDHYQLQKKIHWIESDFSFSQIEMEKAKSADEKKQRNILERVPPTPEEHFFPLIETWNAKRVLHPDDETVLLAFRKAEVAELNQLAHERVKQHMEIAGSNEKGTFEESFLLTMDLEKQRLKEREGKKEKSESKNKLPIELFVGEPVLFLKNDYDLNVRNGERALVKSIEGTRITASFVDKKNNTAREVSFDTKQYPHFDYGYAMTVHKAQGATVDHVLVYLDGNGWNRYLSYVAMTRHRKSLELFVNEHSLKDVAALKRTLSRAPLHDNAIRYPVSFAVRRGFDSESLVGRALNQLAKFTTEIKDAWQVLYAEENRFYVGKGIRRNEVKNNHMIESKHFFEHSNYTDPKDLLEWFRHSEWNNLFQQQSNNFYFNSVVQTLKSIHEGALSEGIQQEPERQQRFWGILASTMEKVQERPWLSKIFHEQMPTVMQMIDQHVAEPVSEHLLIQHPDWKKTEIWNQITNPYLKTQMENIQQAVSIAEKIIKENFPEAETRLNLLNRSLHSRLEALPRFKPSWEQFIELAPADLLSTIAKGDYAIEWDLNNEKISAKIFPNQPTETLLPLSLHSEWKYIAPESTNLIPLRKIIDGGKELSALVSLQSKKQSELNSTLEKNLLEIRKIPPLWESFSKLMPQVSKQFEMQLPKINLIQKMKRARKLNLEREYEP